MVPSFICGITEDKFTALFASASYSKPHAYDWVTSCAYLLVLIREVRSSTQMTLIVEMDEVGQLDVSFIAQLQLFLQSSLTPHFLLRRLLCYVLQHPRDLSDAPCSLAHTVPAHMPSGKCLLYMCLWGLQCVKDMACRQDLASGVLSSGPWCCLWVSGWTNMLHALYMSSGPSSVHYLQGQFRVHAVCGVIIYA